MDYTHIRPLGFGEILDGGFKIFRRHFAVLAITVLIPYGVSAILNFLLLRNVTSGAAEQDPATFFLFFGPVWTAGMIAMLLAWGALSWQTSEAWIGGPVSVADGYAAGRRSFFRLLGAGVISYLMMGAVFMVFFLPAAIVLGIVTAISTTGGGAGPVGGFVALAAMLAGFLLAGILGAGLLACTLPAVVVEGVGPFRAISRSIDLSRGAILRTGGVVVVAFLIAFLPVVGLMLLTGQFNELLNPEAQTSTSALFLQQLTGLVSSSFTTPFVVAVISVVYYDRRVRNEALDIQLAASRMQAPTGAGV